ERQLGLEHDDVPEVRRAVLVRDLLAEQLLDLPLRVHHADFGDDLGELRAVAAGIHVHPAAYGSGNHDEALHTGEPRLGGVARQRLVLDYLAPKLDLGRGRGRRCGGPLGRGLRRCLGLRYGWTADARLPAGGFSAAAGFTFVVLSCHSWRLLTLPVRLRKA